MRQIKKVMKFKTFSFLLFYLLLFYGEEVCIKWHGFIPIKAIEEKAIYL